MKRPVTREYVDVALPIVESAIASADSMSDEDIQDCRRTLQKIEALPLEAAGTHARPLLKMLDHLEAIKHDGATRPRLGVRRRALPTGQKGRHLSARVHRRAGARGILP